MDDLMVTSSSWQEHMNNLQLLLNTLRNNNLTCNPTQCKFVFTEFEYLGYCISEKGIRMSAKKLKTIKAIVSSTYKS